MNYFCLHKTAQGFWQRHRAPIRASKWGIVYMGGGVRLLLFCALSVGSCASSQAENGVRTMDTHFQEVHHRVDNFDHPIVWDHHLTVILSGKNNIHETWDSHNNNSLQTSRASESTFGYEGKAYVWHVLGANKLARFQEFLQHTMTIIISMRPDNSCSLQVIYKLKPGYSDMYMPRADNHVMTHYTLPKLLSTSCAIN
jgi:hypothetical protein